MNKGGGIDPWAAGCLVPGCTAEVGVSCRKPNKAENKSAGVVKSAMQGRKRCYGESTGAGQSRTTRNGTDKMTSTVSYDQVKAATSQAAYIYLSHVWYLQNIKNPVRFIKSDHGIWFWSIGEGQHNGSSLTRKECKAHYEAFKAKAEALA